MTDAASAAGLGDVWNQFLAVAGRAPIEVKVGLALGGMLVLILVIDGIRANIFGPKKAQSLYIVREAHGAVRGPTTFAAKGLAVRANMPKKSVRKLSSHKAMRPGINRVPLDLSEGYEVYQPVEVEAPRETDTSLL
jgi:hypothetical protein